MGIRNVGVRGGTIKDQRLITPHGDSEPVRPCTEADGGALITPHGDSELPGHRLLRTLWVSHNPSWGFGTLEQAATESKQADS